MNNGPLLIADDFGLGAGHNAVILDLLAKQKINGTSVMIDGQLDAASVQKLRTLRYEGAVIGLHLNLTHAFAEGSVCHPLQTLMRLSLSRRLPEDTGADFARQTEAFETVFGFLPDYYDGHQHCHCLPGLFQDAARLPRSETTWMRVPLPASAASLLLNIRAGGLKVSVIAALAWVAGRHFGKAGWPVNADFSGFLRLDKPDEVSLWLPRLIKAAGDECVLMVHPGSADDPDQCTGHAPEARKLEAEILLDGASVTAG